MAEKTILCSNYFDVNIHNFNTANTFTNNVIPPLENFNYASLRFISVPLIEEKPPGVKTITIDPVLTESLRDSTSVTTPLNFRINYSITNYNDDDPDIYPRRYTIANIYTQHEWFTRYQQQDTFDERYTNISPYGTITEKPIINFSNNSYIPLFEFESYQLPPLCFLIKSDTEKDQGLILGIINDKEPYFKPPNVKYYDNDLIDVYLNEIQTHIAQTNFTGIRLVYDLKLVPHTETENIKLANFLLPPKKTWKDPDQYGIFYNYLVTLWNSEKNKKLFFARIQVTNVHVQFDDKAFVENVSESYLQSPSHMDIDDDDNQLFIYLKQLYDTRIANQSARILSSSYLTEDNKSFNRFIITPTVTQGIPLQLQTTFITQLNFEIRNAVNEINPKIDLDKATLILIKFFSSDENVKAKAYDENH